MTRPLEPTEEQLAAARRALFLKPTGNIDTMVRDAWAVIAPMVLEEAAKACEARDQIHSRASLRATSDREKHSAVTASLEASGCAAAIRALKGDAG